MNATQTPIEGLILPITSEFQQLADRFAAQTAVREKAEQIRRNTLAVCVVNAYLQLLDVPTDVARGDSWNPMMQALGNVADLHVPGAGTLSCRVVEVGESACKVPPEEWHDRFGYVAVQLETASQRARLLGFWTGTPTEESLPLHAFQPMETLVDRIHNLEVNSLTVKRLAADSLTATSRAITRLSEWSQGAIASTWQSLDTLVNPATVEYAFRRAEGNGGADLSRAKIIDLGLQLGLSVQVALVVHLTQTNDGTTDILLQVRPQGEATYLPAGLVLTVLDETGEVFIEAIARDIDNYIQLRLSGQEGETFGVVVALDETRFTEQFVI